MDSQKTKLLNTKTVDFSINKKQFSSNYCNKSQNYNIIYIEKSKFNNNIILVKVHIF